MTLCSGIGAPEIAAPWIDWRFASEIEVFPRAVLAERFGYKLPEEHNQGDPILWGDMTEVTPELLRNRGIPLPDLIVAGTPCQAFSIAGLRKGLSDARGNLTMKFVEICHAIVDARPDGKFIALWENVPGVLSDQENAFGNFLGALVGGDDALSNPIGGGWPSEGMVEGPRARIAWRVLDAQHFGVPQRRRRVFLVASFGASELDPAKVLFEPKGVRGYIAQGDNQGQGTAVYSQTGIGKYSEGCGTLRASGGDLGGGSENIVVTNSGDKSFCLNAGGMGCQDAESETLIAFDCKAGGKTGLAISDKSTALRGEGHGGGHSAICFDVDDEFNARSEQMGTLKRGGQGGHQEFVAYGIQANTIGRKPENGGNGLGASLEVSPTLTKTDRHGVAFSFDSLASNSMKSSNPDSGCNQVEISKTLDATRPDPSKNQGGIAIVYENHPADSQISEVETSPTVTSRWGTGGGNVPYVQDESAHYAVRRLTPVECHRLQGFPDDHCAITYRGKPASDGPQYKALGNSMAVPVVHWLLARISQEMAV